MKKITKKDIEIAKIMVAAKMREMGMKPPPPDISRFIGEKGDKRLEAIRDKVKRDLKEAAEIDPISTGLFPREIKPTDEPDWDESWSQERKQKELQKRNEKLDREV